MAGMPVEPREEDEAHTVSFHSSSSIATTSDSVSGSINLNNSGTENMNLQVAPVNASTPSGLHIVPLTASLLPGWNPMKKVRDKSNSCEKGVSDASRESGSLVENAWHHLKSSHSITDAAIAQLAQGKNMLLKGGREKVFEHTFGILPEEKLLKAYVCYLSTSSGLFNGTLYLSTKRLAFHGAEPICQVAPSGQQEWVDHKVVLLLDQLSFVSRSSKGSDRSEKYIQVVTRNGHEFWYKGFVSYDKALKNINEALQHNRENSTDGRIQVRSVSGRNPDSLT